MTHSLRRHLGWLAALGFGALVASRALAQPAAEPAAPPAASDAATTQDEPEPTADPEPAAGPAPAANHFDEARTSHVPMAGTDVEMAIATIGIRAPVAAVRRIVQAYSKYDTIFPYVEQSRIVGRSEGRTDVYLRVPILHGMASVWGKARFSPLQKLGDIEVITADMLEGNLLAWQARWELQPCGDKRTLLTLQLYLELDVPVPDSLVTEELVRVASKTVGRVREQAECPPGAR